MTICIATSNFPPQTGGIAAFSQHLAALLVRDGHRVVVLTPGHTSSTVTEDQEQSIYGYTLIHLHKKFSQYRKEYEKYFSGGSLDAPYWIAAGLAMRDWLLENHKRFAIDIIETGDYGGIGIFLCHAALPPVIITAHGSFIQLKHYNPFNEDAHTTAVARLELSALQQADGIIAHSISNKTELETITGRNIQLAYAPWQLPAIAKGILPDSYCITAGGLQKIKGAAILAAACQQIQTSGKNVQVYWAGGNSYTAPGGASMQNYLAKKFAGVWNRQFTWLEELTPEKTQETIWRSAMVVIPSLWEAFNYVAIEAAAAAKPVIMTAATGASSLFTHGHDAWIIPAGDASALAEAIIYLQENPALQRSLGMQAQQTVRQLYDGENIIRDRIAIYGQVIMARKNRAAFTVSAEQVIAPYRSPVRKFAAGFKKWIKKLAGR